MKFGSAAQDVDGEEEGSKVIATGDSTGVDVV